MNPFYFGNSKKQLFGVYHPPKSRTRVFRDTSVVLCYPIMQEYNRSVWMFRRLADLLAMEGFHILRFDYLGSGDSSGNGDEWSFEQSCDDVATAAEELRNMSGNTKISLVGLRLGATIAASANVSNVEGLVLWDPVVNGQLYSDALTLMHNNMTDDPNRFPVSRRGEAENEILGFPYSSATRRSIEKLDLKEKNSITAKHIAIFGAGGSDEYNALYDSLLASNAKANCKIFDETGSWDVLGELESALLTKNILPEIVTTLTGDSK